MLCHSKYVGIPICRHPQTHAALSRHARETISRIYQESPLKRPYFLINVTTTFNKSNTTGVPCRKRSKTSIGRNGCPWTSHCSFSHRCGCGEKGASPSSKAAIIRIDHGILRNQFIGKYSLSEHWIYFEIPDLSKRKSVFRVLALTQSRSASWGDLITFPENPRQNDQKNSRSSKSVTSYQPFRFRIFRVREIAGNTDFSVTPLCNIVCFQSSVSQVFLFPRLFYSPFFLFPWRWPCVPRTLHQIWPAPRMLERIRINCANKLCEQRATIYP
uniref:Uncharacterized protein n=1 Tax=Candidatus Kentrum sp. MB TaxID=2138164 RepID=A0A451BBF5_9GAMM|nr:MAG: hypothetical protein BECKMB1821G_GA0114241_101429 [Candidatus Kentron sp. MB]VFK31727.1 MAG: hypothetical protein BECKMB1821I_GA0114274_102631 [Candidatus Kentron sp. MB]VFK75631.1 MAG: hypothetical protein BECKMB1821H_GA0114242_102730 [Candidatus Kentron sp. MB]